MIAILDYGIGNVKAVSNMLNKIGVKNKITSDSNSINNADKYILPGIGSYDEAMQRLNNSNLIESLKFNVLKLEKPILGICLGMQLLGNQSKEGKIKGLSWINASFVRFDKHILTPHMGWNEVKSKDTSLFKNLNSARFYFAHSYYLDVTNSNSIATAEYNKYFSCAIKFNNIYGVQFHPEKSHKFGLKLLQNFSSIK